MFCGLPTSRGDAPGVRPVASAPGEAGAGLCPWRIHCTTQRREQTQTASLVTTAEGGPRPRRWAPMSRRRVWPGATKIRPARSKEAIERQERAMPMTANKSTKRRVSTPSPRRWA